MLRTICLLTALSGVAAAQWQNDLTPIATADWNYERAAHLLERAGFSGGWMAAPSTVPATTPAEKATPKQKPEPVTEAAIAVRQRRSGRRHGQWRSAGHAAEVCPR